MRGISSLQMQPWFDLLFAATYSETVARKAEEWWTMSMWGTLPKRPVGHIRSISWMHSKSVSERSRKDCLNLRNLRLRTPLIYFCRPQKYAFPDRVLCLLHDFSNHKTMCTNSLGVGWLTNDREIIWNICDCPITYKHSVLVQTNPTSYTRETTAK